MRSSTPARCKPRSIFGASERLISIAQGARGQGGFSRRSISAPAAVRKKLACVPSGAAAISDSIASPSQLPPATGCASSRATSRSRYEATVFPSTASMVHRRRSVFAGMRGPSCGLSLSRWARMKSMRQRRLAASGSASRLSGKPPRSQSASRRSLPVSPASSDASSTQQERVLHATARGGWQGLLKVPFARTSSRPTYARRSRNGQRSRRHRASSANSRSWPAAPTIRRSK
jgi:hypothetical protein